MIIHFFRERSKPRIDFYQLIDGYFDNLENSTITSNDNELQVTIKMDNFDFKYCYYITKRSRVSSLYKLNLEYININLLCEIPSILPQFLSRLIFKQINDICEKFELSIFYEKFDNIRKFDMFELITALGRERMEFLDSNPNAVSYKVPMNILNDMCRYQSMLTSINSLIKDDIIVNKYNIMVDKKTNIVRTCIIWKAGTPTIFPPHLNYVQIEEDENQLSLIPIEIFYKYVEKFMYEIKDDTINYKLLYLNEKNAQKAKKLIKKMRKAIVSFTNFDEIKITELIES